MFSALDLLDMNDIAKIPGALAIKVPLPVPFMDFSHIRPHTGIPLYWLRRDIAQWMDQNKPKAPSGLLLALGFVGLWLLVKR